MSNTENNRDSKASVPAEEIGELEASRLNELSDYLASYKGRSVPAYVAQEIFDAYTALSSALEATRRERDEALKVLTKHAVVSRHRMCQGGGLFHWGYSCEICDAEVTNEEVTPRLSELIHRPTCPLAVKP